MTIPASGQPLRSKGECVLDPTIVARLIKRPRQHGPLDELTGREREVLALIAEGRSNHGIAEILVLSPKTVEAHISRIMAKLGLDDTPAASSPCWPSSAPEP
jgi:DNA-binding NarL/FixJ family response regulator